MYYQHHQRQGSAYDVPSHIRQSSDYAAFPTPYNRKYNRTHSFDTAYGTNAYPSHFHNAGTYGVYGFSEPVGYWDGSMGSRANSGMTLNERHYDYSASAINRLYKPQPVTYNYNANSFIGWQRRSLPVRFPNTNTNDIPLPPSCPTAEMQSYTQLNVGGGGFDTTADTSISGGTAAERLSKLSGSRVHLPPPPPYPHSGSGGGSFMNGAPPLLSSTLHYAQPSQHLDQNMIYSSLPPTASASLPAQSISASYAGRSKLRLWIILCVMVIMVAVLVAMGVAVYSQVRTAKSSYHYVCQYQGSFLITDGPVLDFDGQLLDHRSAKHKSLASSIKRSIDRMLEQTVYAQDYEGSEVVSFRFIISRPALEVKFFLKTKVTSDIGARDLLLVFDEALRHNSGLFRQFSIDERTLNIEGQTLFQL